MARNNEKKNESPSVRSTAAVFSCQTRESCGMSPEELKERNAFLEETRKAALNIFEDMAEVEKSLRKRTTELEKFQQAVDASFDHMIITDPDGVILYANRAAEEMTGFSRKEMVGGKPSLWGRQMPEAVYAKMWKTIKTDKSRYSAEITNMRKSGEKYQAYVRIAPILSKGGAVKFFVGIERDISKERELLETLSKIRKSDK